MTPTREAPSKIRTRVRVEALQAVMARRGISQAQLAEMLEVSRPTVCRLINGIRDPRADYRQRLMTVLGLAFDDLFELVPTPRGKR